MSYKVSEIQIVYKPKRGKRPQVRASKDAYKILVDIIDWNTIEVHETFHLLLLNRNNRVIGTYKVSVGGVAGTVVDCKLIFSVALKSLACSIICCHNHPSGNLLPSQADLDLTRKIKKAGEVMDVFLLDHLIIAPDGSWMSFADDGHL